MMGNTAGAESQSALWDCLCPAVAEYDLCLIVLSELNSSGVNHGGQGGTVLPKVLAGGIAVLTMPRKLKLRRDSAGSCFVRSHKEYVTYYNFEAVIVMFQLSPIYYVQLRTQGDPGLLTKAFKQIKSVIL